MRAQSVLKQAKESTEQVNCADHIFLIIASSFARVIFFFAFLCIIKETVFSESIVFLLPIPKIDLHWKTCCIKRTGIPKHLFTNIGPMLRCMLLAIFIIIYVSCTLCLIRAVCSDTLLIICIVRLSSERSRIERNYGMRTAQNNIAELRNNYRLI